MPTAAPAFTAVRLPCWTATEGAAWTPLAWTLPIERLAEFPPPTCTDPTEFRALFPPVPVTPAGAVTRTVVRPTFTDAAGAVATGLTWTEPTDPVDVLPPPTCAVPTEFEAVLPPEPETVVGAEASTTGGAGSAAAVRAMASASIETTPAVANIVRVIAVSFF
jgi:hypothetical protein